MNCALLFALLCAALLCAALLCAALLTRSARSTRFTRSTHSTHPTHQERTLRLINSSRPRGKAGGKDDIVRYTDFKPGAPADRLLDDQWVST